MFAEIQMLTTKAPLCHWISAKVISFLLSLVLVTLLVLQTYSKILLKKQDISRRGRATPYNGFVRGRERIRPAPYDYRPNLGNRSAYKYQY